MAVVKTLNQIKIKNLDDLKLYQYEHSLESKFYLVVNNATAHEFAFRWDELLEKNADDFDKTWSEILLLFDCGIVSINES